MKKITKDAVDAFMKGGKFMRDNTRVGLYSNGDSLSFGMFLHANLIARRPYRKDGAVRAGDVEITNSGWFTNTTKERLNGIPGVDICQKKGRWFLNGEEWDGGIITIN